MKRSVCQSCGAFIYWAEQANAKKHPIDAEPVEGGTIKVVIRNGALFIVTFFDPNPTDGENRYVSHFATCPHANKHRRRR